MTNLFVLSSGSKGNASIVKVNDDTCILIDQGLTEKEFENRLKDANISEKSIKYVLVTHSHIDHIKSIKSFSSDMIFSMEKTLPFPLYNRFEYYKEYDFGDFKVVPVKTSHDAPDSCGFVFYIEDKKIVYITDTGKLSKKTLKYLINADEYYFECNHDLDMLENSGRPEFLKERIRGNKGHLSNIQCFTYLNELVGDKTKLIILAHISEECNDTNCIKSAELQYFSQNMYYKNIKIVEAKQWEITKI